MITQIKYTDNIYELTSTIGYSVEDEYGFKLNTLNNLLFTANGNYIEKMDKFSNLTNLSMVFRVVVPHIVNEILKKTLTNTL